MPAPVNRFRTMACLGLSALLAACGGGGGGGGGGNDKVVASEQGLSGVVAKGAPLAGYEVLVLSAYDMGTRGGSTGYTATTDAEGRYSIASLSDLRPPYIIEARKYYPNTDRAYPRLLALALERGTANVTPLTDLQVAQLAGRSLSFFIVDYAPLANVSRVQMDSARQAVIDYLQQRPDPQNQAATVSVDASAVGNFVTGALRAVPSDHYDAVLEQLQQTMLGNENIYAVEEHMMSRTATVDLSTLIGNVRCEFNKCGALDGQGQIVAPYLSKYAMVKQLVDKMNGWGFSYIDCGANPQVQGFEPGVNRISADGTAWRVNHLDSNSLSKSLLSFTDIDFYISSSPGGHYIERFYAQDYDIGLYDQADQYDLHFDQNGRLTSAGIYDHGIAMGSTCTGI